MNLDESDLEMLRTAMLMFHKDFLIRFRYDNYSIYKIDEDHIIRIRDKIDKELETLNNQNEL